MYEHRKQPLLSAARFRKRVIRHFILALLILAVGLGIGVLGYHCLGELNWIDALLNASVILGGMGPVDPSAFVHRQNICLGLCFVFRISFYRHSIPNRSTVCPSHFAPLQ